MSTDLIFILFHGSRKTRGLPLMRRFTLGIVAIAAATIIASDVSAAIVDNLTAYWRFDETSGTTANDSIANYDATLRPNASFVNDAQRGRVMSTGTGNALYDDVSVPFLSTSAGSLLAWIKVPSTGG